MLKLWKTVCFKSYLKRVPEETQKSGYITPYTPKQNGLIEKFFRTLQKDCVWKYNFKSCDEVFRVISNWLDIYHTERAHSALGYKIPMEYKQQLKKLHK